jgi:hypothetical protein
VNRKCVLDRNIHLRPPRPPPKSTWQKFKDYFRAFLAFVFSKVGICVLVVGYLILGAVAFQAIEAPAEEGTHYFVAKYRDATVSRLWKITERLNTLHRGNWTLETKAVIDEFQAHIIGQVGDGYGGSDNPEIKWNFPGALLYCITVITTIGR